MPRLEPLLHVAEQAVWEAAVQDGADYAPASLFAAGFVHLCRPDQVRRVVARHFRNRRDLVLLVLDPRKLTGDLKWEDTYGDGETWAHHYGPIPREAVVRAFPFDTMPDDD